MNGYASCFLVCKQLWFKGRVGRGADDNMWSLTCSLALYPYRYIFPSRGVMRESPHDHQTYQQPQLHQLPPTPPSSSLLVYLCRLTLWLRLSLKTPCSLRSCRDLLMAVWVWKQRSNSRTRALSVRDDEEGHLICRSGDVLQERCTHCHYSIVTFSIWVLMHRAFTWHGSAWWCLARMLFALAEIAGWIARMLAIWEGR